MTLDELFDVRNGVASSRLSISHHPAPNHVPYLRPAKTQQRTIAGWVPESEIGSDNIYPEGTLFVSTDGAGSHSYSYVSKFRFACNSNVAVLLPKRDMSVNEKLYYARCISMNRHKFSYGRKPKGDRLKQIELPTVPDWVNEKIFKNNFSSLSRLMSLSTEAIDITATDQTETFVSVSDLFNVFYGTNLELNALEPAENGTGVNFVSRSSKNNGISARVKLLPDISPIQGGVLTVAGGGSVLETFLQLEPFYSGFHLFYLVPRESMCAEELLYYASCIRENRFRYSYGRQANRTLGGLKIPARSSIPHWVFGSLAKIVEQVEIDLKT
ncbi:restriction endonuclease subunit S [Dethiosulfovibrio acidaminovorans]|uniref:Restriction endonuclease subunit S n=3 Tax=Dethiosulfovibrionaceae TaxID=3029088 RepID=A0ABS9EPM3_9BACT|nr:restriction endonuclease subunit S [Dethiosulfovibrio acidaminovorans]MCF4114465.1 restriction endonuclease subunit S [Dethiosulfovibrio russensis]MCF4143142.1 restriction endonuclease subunit S [Dethiosulfovibrio marinus]MCF4146183.1 restriction endonuclease subunit S [Dethiosulfovibrio acidaminovorans]